MPTPILTIGYGTREISDFLSILHQYRVDFLIDIRSHPYSRFRPDYGQPRLRQRLRDAQVRYVFMGHQLGGRPAAPGCYINGRVDYLAVRQQGFYQHGIARLHSAYEQGLHVALMCAEMKPHRCHRSKLVGVSLASLGIPVQHIDEHAHLREHTDIMELRESSAPYLLDTDGENRGPVKSYRPRLSGKVRRCATS